ncbi:hypothetical protein QMK19_38280 [Streptomyces sp. H10-C2]|uniref:hypothetical protein n=1 Tax=unclassified Streptomyces TaxID=2593676 RepID=UPI0024B8A2FE|nr:MULTISPECIES: hypothetical protein [unclassified Streptomyces]MDJ0347028.1 hypothetical protein [Streptomyces sp. PH10-H1]MDJ0375296.1 hypothetical protein [Streptomyces sp. H10-C2]
MDTPHGPVPAALCQAIGHIVALCRTGDDPERLALLLDRLAGVADVAALILLRRRLSEHLDDHTGVSTGPASARQDRAGLHSVR